MKKSDWIVLRLARKIILNDNRAALDLDVRRAALYLQDKYGKKYLEKCVEALFEERKETT